MKLAITGANGFIGQYVVAEALKQGHTVVALTRQAKETYLANFLVEHPNTNIDSLNVSECNLNDNSNLNSILSGCDAVIHLAASIGKKNTNDSYKQTLEITQNIIASINSNNIKTLILISSISVLNYSDQKPHSIINEKIAFCENNDDIGDYALMKRDQEKLCQQWQLETGKQLITIRPGLVYSDKQLSDAHAGFIKKGMGITASHNGQVPLIKVDQVAREIISLFGYTLFAKDTFHLIGTPPIHQKNYLEQLKQQGLLKFNLPLPWKAYDLLGRIFRWVLIKAKKTEKIPDSLKANSIAARQKPFIFSSEKIDNIIK